MNESDKQACGIARKLWGHGGLRLVLVCFCALWAAAVAGAADRPNIVFILSDDQGIEAIAGDYWSNELNVHTPNLSALARQGVVFRNTRACPNCSPTRAGIMTGRSALQQGVIDILQPESPGGQRDRLSLQTQENTVAESLKTAGYYTVLADKWHCGWNVGLGQKPEQQGFNVFFDLYDYAWLDDSLQTGDEHISNMVDLSVDAVINRPQPGDPYALFFWSLDAHERVDPERQETMGWWRVDSSLLPSGENYYAAETERNRYRAVVEAFDTEVGRLLRELGVVDQNLNYRPESNTIVFFTSDNGTPQSISAAPARAKGTLYDGGIRVPLFVFGEGVDKAGADDRLTSYLDFYETLCDIADVSTQNRGNSPRMSMSFADHIGWSTSTLPDPEFVISSRGDPNDADAARMAIVSTRYKLIVKAGGFGQAPLIEDEFYDLQADPAEQTNLNVSGMTLPQRREYVRMRDAVTSYWGTAVGGRTIVHVDLPMLKAQSLNSQNQRSSTVMTVGWDNVGQSGTVEGRAMFRFNIAKLDQLMPPGKTVNDIISAQVIVGFRADSASTDATDTGPIRVRRMTTDWYSNNRNWSQLVNAWDGTKNCGMFDAAPHIIPDPDGNSLASVPMIQGTPVSFGGATDLVDLVRAWYNGTTPNHGVVLIADAMNSVGGGDQRLSFLVSSTLRLTFTE